MKPIYLYMCPFFPSHDSWRGGFFLDAVKALMRDGRYDVRVLVRQPGPDYSIDGIKVHRFESFKVGDSDYLSVFTDPIKKWIFARKLAKMGLRPSDIAVCHTHIIERMSFYGVWLKRQNPNCLVLLHHHWNGLYGYPGGKMNRLGMVRAIEYLRLRRDYLTADAHVFCSKSCREGFGKFYRDGDMHDLREDLPLSGHLPKMRYNDAVVCYNGIDTSVFYPAVKASDNKATFRIGCVANFIPTKSQITLIKAFAKVCDQMPVAELIFVGTGLELAKCQKWVDDNGLSARVHFLSEMDHLALPDFYRSLSLYVLPSYLEAFNCSLIEAWACGVPCITTNTISFKEILPCQEWNQWLFVANDESDLAKKLMWVYNIRPNTQELTMNLSMDSVILHFSDWIDGKRVVLGLGHKT